MGSPNTGPVSPSQERVSSWSVGGWKPQSTPSAPGTPLPRALLLMRLRWLLEVWDSSVACWWFESTGLVAMMLSLYLFIRDSLALSLPEQEEMKARCFRDKDLKKGGRQERERFPWIRLQHPHEATRAPWPMGRAAPSAPSRAPQSLKGTSTSSKSLGKSWDLTFRLSGHLCISRSAKKMPGEL